MIFLTESQTMERLFDLDWQLLADSCLTIIAILFLVMIMSFFLFNPARKVLDDRKNKIRGELEEANHNMEEAQALKEEYEEKMRAADKKVDEILSEARQKAIVNQDRIVADAKEEAARILERARVEAELEKQKMADEVKREMISVASVMAGKIVAASIDATKQKQLIEETLKEMGEETWLS